MKRLLPIFCFCICLNLFSQDQKLEFDQVMIKFNALLEVEDYGKAELFLEASMAQFEKEKAWQSYFNAVLERAWLYEDTEEIIMYFESQIVLGQKKLDASDNLLAELYHDFGGVFYTEGDYLKAIDIYLKALDVRQKALEFPAYDLARTNINIGKCFTYSGYYEDGIKYLKAAKNNYEGVERFDKVNACDLEIAYCYSNIGEYQIAEGIYQEALSFSKKEYGQNTSETALVFNLMGDLFYDQRKYKLAKENYLKGEQIYGLHTDYKEDQAVSLNGLGNVYKATGNTTKAVEYYKRAASIIAGVYGEDNLLTAKAYENIGLAYRQGDDYEEALNWLLKALDIRVEQIKDQKKLDLNSSYHNLGDFYLEQGDYKQALEYLQKAIQQQVLKFNESNYLVNPSLDDISLLIGSKQGLVKDLKFKGQALQEGFSQNGDIEYLNASKSTFSLATQLIDQMRSEFIGAGTKTFWLNETFPIFENAIEVCFQSYQTRSSERLFDEMLSLMEQNKAVLLMETLHLNRGLTQSAIPDSLINRYQQFFKQKENIQSKLINAIEAQSGDSTIQGFEHQMIQVNKDKAIFEEFLRDHFPAFKRLAKSSSNTANHNIRPLLSSHQAFIEYFVGDMTTYIIGLCKDQYVIKAIPTSELQLYADELLDVINPPQDDKKSAEENFRKFTQSAHSLYRLLLKEILDEFPVTINELLIVTDDVISYLPFDILLQEANDSEEVDYSLDHLSYLIKKYSVSYAYSGTVLEGLKTSANPHNRNLSFLGIAPVFEGDEKLVSGKRACGFETPVPLKHTRSEVETINTIFNGTTLLGEEATKASFQEMASQYSILHLATHACADPVNSARNRIFFSDDHLYNHELSNLNIAADMVVLSACETGVGEFKRGEGVMSLARGFAYSGTPSITMSLWSVYDGAASELMIQYYKGLNKGMAKGQALRQSKLDYLANQESYRKLHPRFWAAFIHYGDIAPIVDKPIWPFYLGGALFIFLTLGLYHYFRR